MTRGSYKNKRRGRKRTPLRPAQVYRLPEEGYIMGVCAGIADYFDINVSAVRIVVFFMILFSGVITGLLIYVVIGFILPTKYYEDCTEPEEEQFWRETRKSPKSSATDLLQRFRDIERRTANLETTVTSKRFKLDRELRSLED